MLNEILEKYWKDRLNQPIYRWLGISQVTWAQQKKTKIARKHLEKIYEYFDMDEKLTEHEKVKVITEAYYHDTIV